MAWHNLLTASNVMTPGGETGGGWFVRVCATLSEPGYCGGDPLTQGAGCAPGEWLWGSDHWDGVECCGSIDLIVAGGGYFVAGIEASRRGGEATQRTLGEYSGLGWMRLRAAVAVRRQHDQGDDGLS
jgi:hypothetical protein